MSDSEDVSKKIPSKEWAIVKEYLGVPEQGSELSHAIVTIDAVCPPPDKPPH